MFTDGLYEFCQHTAQILYATDFTFSAIFLLFVISTVQCESVC